MLYFENLEHRLSSWLDKKMSTWQRYGIIGWLANYAFAFIYTLILVCVYAVLSVASRFIYILLFILVPATTVIFYILFALTQLIPLAINIRVQSLSTVDRLFWTWIPFGSLLALLFAVAIVAAVAYWKLLRSIIQQ